MKNLCRQENVTFNVILIKAIKQWITLMSYVKEEPLSYNDNELQA